MRSGCFCVVKVSSRGKFALSVLGFLMHFTDSTGSSGNSGGGWNADTDATGTGVATAGENS